MMPTDQAELAARIEDAVSAVPAVTNVFRAGSLVSNALAAAATAVAGTSAAPRVALRQLGASIEVEVSIGVAGSAGAPDTLRLVHVVIEGILDAAGVASRNVRVTVSRITA